MARDKISFKCKACKRRVYESELSQYDRSHVYCPDCRKVVYEDNRDPKITLICDQCGAEFHPRRNWKERGKYPKYCSVECRWARYRETR